MTTNKPEVKRMQESEDGYYVLLSDYKALQAECDRLKSELAGMSTATPHESQAADLYAAESAEQQPELFVSNPNPDLHPLLQAIRHHPAPGYTNANPDGVWWLLALQPFILGFGEIPSSSRARLILSVFENPSPTKTAIISSGIFLAELTHDELLALPHPFLLSARDYILSTCPANIKEIQPAPTYRPKPAPKPTVPLTLEDLGL